jgi:hypothetical protein
LFDSFESRADTRTLPFDQITDGALLSRLAKGRIYDMTEVTDVVDEVKVERVVQNHLTLRVLRENVAPECNRRFKLLVPRKDLGFGLEGAGR